MKKLFVVALVGVVAPLAALAYTVTVPVYQDQNQCGQISRVRIGDRQIQVADGARAPTEILEEPVTLPCEAVVVSPSYQAQVSGPTIYVAPAYPIYSYPLYPYPGYSFALGVNVGGFGRHHGGYYSGYGYYRRRR